MMFGVVFTVLCAVMFGVVLCVVICDHNTCRVMYYMT